MNDLEILKVQVAPFASFSQLINIHDPGAPQLI